MINFMGMENEIDENDFPDFLLWREMKRNGQLAEQPGSIDLSEQQVLRLYAARKKAIDALNLIKLVNEKKYPINEDENPPMLDGGPSEVQYQRTPPNPTLFD